ncbi:MAG TPA: hypothetical protein VH247_11165 [Thermoleophilaceae bacterium]|nr:hypothetical protein [Thermoleophilaceae bacterium]
MRRFTQTIVMAGLMTAALTGNAAAQDLRSPDARDSARATTPTLDLRSPDARDSARNAGVASDVAQATALHDLRSPDARSGDNVATYTPGVAPSAAIVSVPANGFQWGDAGIGAAVMLGLIALCGGMVLVVSSRRHRRRLPRAIG